MSKKTFQYHKLNFILAVIGFIGSLGFYFSVLQEVTARKPDQQLMKQIRNENQYLKGQIKDLQSKANPMKTTKQQQTDAENSFIDWIKHGLLVGNKYNRVQTEKAANALGIVDKTMIKELTECGIVESARDIALGSGDQKSKFDNIVNLYNRQTNLSFRTSQSILLNQYSTPAPIGYLMGLYCGIDSRHKTVFEPSAGNGLLTIATDPSRVIVNEIDRVRCENLKRSNYEKILTRDASVAFDEYAKSFDAVITNPPFGSIGKSRKVFIDGYRIYDLDHLMSIIALNTIKDNGKAAFIIGGHTGYDKRGRINAGKNRIFFNYLYHNYNVQDVIPIDSQKLYSRQGTSFDTRLILVNGRKSKPEGVAPLASSELNTIAITFDQLYNRVTSHIMQTKPMNTNLLDRAKALKALLSANTLEGPYTPSSKSMVLNTQVPDSMDYEIHQSLKRITQDVGGDIDNFVRHRLGYPTKDDLFRALSAEQIDAVGMSIYNIEALGQAMIIGDQTGIGKGRIAAAMVRYSVEQGKKPVFLTEKANLFSDLYRDLSAIGSAHLKPFIVNARESKTDIKDEDGLVMYHAPLAIEQNQIFASHDLKNYDFVMATYSQFSSAERKPIKPEFLRAISEGSILIMDESHNASGSSNTGAFMQSIVGKTSGAVFLSATFAKRPDNMPIYGMKTAISEANMSKLDLVDAIASGGVALQEVLASQLVAEGQMIRRERSFEGIEVNYITLDNYAIEHRAIADNVTAILRDIIAFQKEYVSNLVDEMDSMAAAAGAEIGVRTGTDNAGVDNTPYFSKVFNVINQMLFSIKAEAVADRAIMRLKEGKKPVIAFSSTMGSFLEQMEDAHGSPVRAGQEVYADFSIVLEKGLEGIMRYTITLPDGTKEHAVFDISELGVDAQAEYARIQDEIANVSTGITISPIDIIIERINKAGFSVAEVTGRKLKLQINAKRTKGIVEPRKKINTNDAFRQFNNNEIDVLLINQSGSTGASAHAVATSKVPPSSVKQRVMIVLQPELDINIEIQKRGRINRTGQLQKPVYDYINSAIPAEMRLMMMLQKKLKSLDANTSSNQKQSSSILSVPDFLNKYGDEIVAEYLRENLPLNAILGDPLKLGSSDQVREDAALKVSGRVAVLSAKMQEEFYVDIKERYENHVNYLKQTGDYDLEVEEMDLKTETISSSVIKIGRGGHSSFGEDSVLEKVNANILRKPFKVDEVRNLLQQSLNGLSSQEVTEQLLENYSRHATQVLEADLKAIESYYDNLVKKVPNEKKIQKLKETTSELVTNAINERAEEIKVDRIKRIEDEIKLASHKKIQIQGLFKSFTIGKRLLYPMNSFDGEAINQLTIFLGFKIDPKRKNPYAPSAIGMRFAIASSQKYLEIPASLHKEISAIRGASTTVVDYGIENTLKDWDATITENNKDRGIRFIITGNILQAFADFHGKLVSYTTMKGEIEKGILLPEYWIPEKGVSGNVVVPITKALKVFKSLPIGKDIMASHGMAFFRTGDETFRLIVPSVMREGGEVFLNAEILKWVDKNNFEKVGKNMSTHFELSSLEPFLATLEEQLGASVKLSESQIENIGLVHSAIRPRNKIALPPPQEQGTEKIRRLRLRAQALKLKLKLLTLQSKAS